MSIDTHALRAGDESMKTYYIHPAAFGGTQNPGHGHIPVVKADDFEKLRDELEAAEKRIVELEAREVNPALFDVIAERQRQVSAEGWTPEHDDQYEHGQLAGAASCYARHVNARGWIFNTDPGSYQAESESTNWPWHHEWWKPTSPRRDLLKAGALILAEIERIDRAAGISVKGECKGGKCE